MRKRGAEVCTNGGARMNKRLWLKFFVGAALGLAMLAPAHAAPNLLMNPGFESGVGSHSFKSWQTRLGSPASSVSNPLRVQAAGPVRIVNNHVASFAGGSPEGHAVLNQSINTITGHIYQVSGYWKPEAALVGSHPSGYNGFILFANGAFVNSTRSVNATSYQSFTYTFAGSGGSELLSFGSWNALGTSALDELSVMDLSVPKEAPEIDPKGATVPAALAVTGLLLAADARKKRTQA